MDTPEPGGLDASRALEAMETRGTHEAVGAVDLIEVAPTHDPAGTTARLAADLLSTLLAGRFAE